MINQFEFRKGKETIDAIFIVEKCMKKSKKHHMNIHITFINFKSVFDSIWSKAQWKMLRHIGVFNKIVNVIKVIEKHKIHCYY